MRDVRPAEEIAVGEALCLWEAELFQSFVHPGGDGIGPVWVRYLYRATQIGECRKVVDRGCVGRPEVRQGTGKAHTLLEVREPVVPGVRVVADLIGPLLVRSLGSSGPSVSVVADSVGHDEEEGPYRWYSIAPRAVLPPRVLPCI